MKTEDLVSLLAAQAQPVQRRATSRRLGLALALALPLSIAIMAGQYGVRPTLMDDLRGAMGWLKILLPAAIALAAFPLVHRLARPGVPARGAWLLVVPVLLLWSLALVEWSAAPADMRPALLWGRTWRTCALNITALSLPMLLASMLALRSLAPTRPAPAGAAAGALAGGAGAAVYALHCPELAAPFLAVWYVAGMAIPVALGALAGRKLLRW